MMKKKYKLLVVVLTVVFSMMLVIIFSTFSYLIYQKSVENHSQSQFKEDMEIVLNDNEQETTDESMDESESVENENQITDNILAKNFNTLSLLRFTFPSIAMMVFMGIYTIIDTIFRGVLKITLHSTQMQHILM